MSDGNKTMKEAFKWLRDTLGKTDGMQAFMALKMLETIEKELAAGKGLDDKISFE